MGKRTASTKTQAPSKDLERENEKNKGKISIAEYLKKNNISTDVFFNKLVPKLKSLDFNSIIYDEKFLNKIIKGEK
jgi:hypothetical protein